MKVETFKALIKMHYWTLINILKLEPCTFYIRHLNHEYNADMIILYWLKIFQRCISLLVSLKTAFFYSIQQEPGVWSKRRYIRPLQETVRVSVYGEPWWEPGCGRERCQSWRRSAGRCRWRPVGNWWIRVQFHPHHPLLPAAKTSKSSYAYN